jgi:protein PsiE
MNDPNATESKARLGDEPPETEVVEPSTAALKAFRYMERGLLLFVATMTLVAAGMEVWHIVEARSIDLADILLMFLYTEVIAMVAVFYAGSGPTFIYPIFIAITALARLIVLQGKDMAPENILYEAFAILALAVAIVVLGLARKV